MTTNRRTPGKTRPTEPRRPAEDSAELDQTPVLRAPATVLDVGAGTITAVAPEPTEDKPVTVRQLSLAEQVAEFMPRSATLDPSSPEATTAGRSS